MGFLAITEKAEQAFIAYIQGNLSLEGWTVQPGREYETRPFPCIVVNGAEDKPRTGGARGIFDVELELIVISDATADQDATSHNVAITALSAVINDKNALRTTLNAGAGGRPVRDFRVYDYFLRGSP